jgi:hypothetical protein
MTQQDTWTILGGESQDFLSTQNVPSANYPSLYVAELPGLGVAKLSQDIQEVRDELAEIKRLLNEVLKAMATTTEPTVCRDVSEDEARELILELVRSHPGGLCYSEIIDALNLDPDLVIDTCDALAAEGKLKDLGPVGG